MTLFLNFRAGTGRALSDEPQILRRTSVGPGNVGVEKVGILQFKSEIADRKLALVTHGFNVGYAGGVRCLGRIEEALALDRAQWTFIGVLWPGDNIIPFVNYPLEARDAARCGRNLARFLNTHATRAAGFSFASHSMGARVILDAAQALAWSSSNICVTAAAADDDCLTAQYDAARNKAGRISVLASTEDRVLQLAYPAGDLLSDVTYDDDSPFGAALGRRGTRRPAPARATNFQTAVAQDYGHNAYFPSGDGEKPGNKSARVMAHLGAWFTGRTPTWP